MEKLYYVMGGWIAFNLFVVIMLVNRRAAPHARHSLADWVMGTQRSSRRRHVARALVAAAHHHH
jgi:hypothetical protein